MLKDEEVEEKFEKVEEMEQVLDPENVVVVKENPKVGPNVLEEDPKEAMILGSVDGPNAYGDIGRWTLFHKFKPGLGLNSAKGGIDTNLDCQSPSSSSNPTTIDCDWQRRRDKKDQKLLEDDSPTETSVCITIGCD
ncbi:unnamed protein product [Lactuca saligna]|uniref:Uncharacterized protein n=1 Tax=Lactuca saligna TaxID=75948 RepID=A0AA35VW63_LACSI|nr:unnamed protein product [Lactuca saligna]